MPLRRLHRSMTPTSSRSLVTKPGEAVGVYCEPECRVVMMLLAGSGPSKGGRGGGGS